MSLGRRIGLVVLVALAGAIGLFAILAALLWYETSYNPRYDRDSRFYNEYAFILSEAERAIRNGSREPVTIDLLKINDGNWKTACLIGGYKDPIAIMRQMGASIQPKDEERMSDAGKRGFRLAPVEEFEAVIAYVDGSDRAHFIHFQHGFGTKGQHFSQCVTKLETRVRLTQ
jgi:hypothetical protein